MKISHIKLLIGTVLIIFFLVWLPTLPSYFSFFDFSTTGNIGDTIGGLSSPVIGIIGSYLVFISFQEQLKANKMQFEALQDERKRYEADRWYQKKLENFNDLKKSINSLRFTLPVGEKPEWDYYDEVINFDGINALRLINQKLENFNNLNRIQKYAIDLYVYEFGQRLVNFRVLVIAVNANKEIFPLEYSELSESIDEIYYAHLLSPLEELSSKLNPINDTKNIRSMFYKIKNELENYIDPNGIKRSQQEEI